VVANVQGLASPEEDWWYKLSFAVTTNDQQELLQLWWDSHGANEHVTSKHNAHLKHHAHLHHVVTTLIVSCVAGAHSGMKVTKRKRGPTKYQLQAKKALDAAQVALRQAKQKLVQAMSKYTVAMGEVCSHNQEMHTLYEDGMCCPALMYMCQDGERGCCDGGYCTTDWNSYTDDSE
jgi:hypothetical protein